MIKKDLKQLLQGLTKDQVIQFSTYSNPTVFSNYRVIEVKPGKHGSVNVMVQDTASNVVTEITTTKNNEVLNLIINDVFHGVHFPYENPIEFNQSNAVNYKARLKPYVGKQGMKIRLESDSTPKYNGVFNVKKIIAKKGILGEIQATLSPESSTLQEDIEFLSYKHSQIVKNIEVLENPVLQS